MCYMCHLGQMDGFWKASKIEKGMERGEKKIETILKMYMLLGIFTIFIYLVYILLL